MNAKITFSLLGCAALLLVIGFSVASGKSVFTMPEERVAKAQAELEIDSGSGEPRVVQTDYSSKCVTPTGVCLVNPQPVGTPCYCGSTPGTISR